MKEAQHNIHPREEKTRFEFLNFVAEAEASVQL